MRRRTIVAAAGAITVSTLIARKLLRRGAERFDGRIVAITGASRGLGLMLAREFGRRGARLAICARDEAAVARAAADLAGSGYDVLGLACDVRDRRSVDEFIDAVRARYGSIDVLVNNAGTIEVGPGSVMTADDYANALQTHFWGPYHAIEAALPALRQTQGRIVNVVSIGGLVAVPHLLPYSVSKFALLGYSFGLRAELSPAKVSVTTICPGLMRTGSARNAHFKGQNRAEYAWFSLGDATPLTSMSAHAAASRIVDATARREALVVLSPQARALAAMQHLFPALTLRVLGIVARLLPGDGGIGERSARGYESTSALSESFLTALTRRAEIDLHQR